MLTKCIRHLQKKQKKKNKKKKNSTTYNILYNNGETINILNYENHMNTYTSFTINELNLHLNLIECSKFAQRKVM